MKVSTTIITQLQLFCVLFVTLNAEIRIIDPPTGNFYTQKGGSVHIKFIATDTTAKTEMCHKAPGSDTCKTFTLVQTPNFKLYNENNEIVVEYSAYNIEEAAAGEYMMKENENTKSVHVHFIKIASKNATLYKEEEDVHISCKVTGVKNRFTIAWMKDGEIITQGARPHLQENETLTIIGAERKDIGAYTCCVTPTGSTANMTANAYVHSAPFVDKFERNKNMVQGDNVFLDCSAYGFPTPIVTWLKDNDAVVLDNRTYVDINRGIEGARLRINDLTLDDRAEYGCKAVNEYNETIQYVSVRVKDKYAALWPFLGICIEVLILCIIIFIYEKRRNKKNQEKEKVSEKSNGQTGKGDDVRQRNKNSVKA